MQLGIQTSTEGWPVEDRVLRVKKANGLVVLRAGVWSGHAEQVVRLVGLGFRPLTICQNLDELNTLPNGVDAELRNEPDIEGPTAPLYAEFVDTAIEVANRKQLRLYVGSVSGLHARGLRYLDALPWAEWPADIVRCSVHCYPSPPSLMVGTDAAMVRVRSIIGDRSIACTETGFNSVEFQQQQQIAGLNQAREFLSRHGFEFAIAYQLVDGPIEPGDSFTVKAGKSYGFMTFEQQWKPEIVSAWTGVPFTDPGDTPDPIEPPPDPSPVVSFDVPVDIVHTGLTIKGVLEVTHACQQTEPPPPEPLPLSRIEIRVLDAASKPITHAQVALDDDVRDVSIKGQVVFDTYGPQIFHVTAAGFKATDRDLPPGEHNVHLERGEPAPGVRPRLAGAVGLTGRAVGDTTGAHLSVGSSFFCAPRLFKDHRARYDKNMAWLARHWFTYYRGFVLTGGWPHPDPWQHAGSYLPSALVILPQMLDDAWQRFNLRCSLTLFDGEGQTPTDSEQDAFVHSVCDILLPRMETIHDVQVANEYGPCQWDYPKGVERLRRHARTLRSRLGPVVPISISARNTSMDGSSPEHEIYAECHKLFDGLLDGIVTVSVNHDSRDTTKIDGPWRHVRQGWERVVHDPQGRPLEPDASIDDEPMGPRSSVAEETNVSRLVGKMVVSFISGRCAYTYHPDPGIWSDLLNPPHNGMGEFVHIEDHPTSEPFARSMDAVVAILPPDLANWSRTSHHISNPPHPFALSFERVGDVFTQIWPDGVTHHGVVRAFCAVRGNEFVCALTGIKDRIDLKWSSALTASLYACGTGSVVGQITADMRATTVPESLDTDIIAIGSWQ